MDILDRSTDWTGFFTGAFTVYFTGLRTQVSITGFNRKLYGHGI